MAGSATTRRVVVGVDGSPNSRVALRRAVMEARRHRAELHVVLAVAPEMAVDPEAEALERRRLERVVTATVTEPPGTPVVLHVEGGPASQVLVRHSVGALALVVGARRHSQHGNPLGGDTVPGCLAEARAPVIVCADHQARHSPVG